MSAKHVDEAVILNQSQMLYLINLLIFVIVAAPKRDWEDAKWLEERRDLWNHYRFRRDLVWSFLDHTLSLQHIHVKQAQTALFLQGRRSELHNLPSTTEHDLFTVLDDELLTSTYGHEPALMRACIAMLAREFVRQSPKELDRLLLAEIPTVELVCGQAYPGDTARAPEQPGPTASTRFRNQKNPS